MPVENPVILDLPGWGAATLTARGERGGIAAVCELVRECAEELGYTEWDLVGHSMGGFIALHMAATWPQSVLSVGVVSGTGPSIISSVRHPLRNFWQLPAFTVLWLAMECLDSLGRAGSLLFRAVRALGALPLLTRPLFAHPKLMHPSVIAALGDELRPHAFSAAASIVASYDVEGMWGRIDCPVRALNGDRDVFSTARDLRQMGELIRHATLSIIDDCGHFAAVERPRDVLVALGFTPPAATRSPG